MALSPEQRRTLIVLLDGDHSVNAPILGANDFLTELNGLSKGLSAILVLDESGSENPKLIDDVHALRVKMQKACAGLARVLSQGA